MAKSVVILGAGPAGLATAYYLCKGGCTDVTLLEAEKLVGGISATMRREDMLFDFGSHRIHPGCDAETLSLVKSLLGDDLLSRPRRGAIWLSGRIVEYPLRIGQMASGLGPLRAARIVASFARQKLLLGSSQPGQRTSETLLVRRFGRALFELFYRPYTTKVFGIPPDQMSPEQARRRVGSKSLLEIARKAGMASPGKFFYPRLGFGQMCDALAEKIQSAGASIVLRASPKKATIKDGRIDQLEFAVGKEKRILKPDFVFSTIPLRSLTLLCAPCSNAVRRAAKELKHRSLVMLYMVVNRDRVGQKDAYYFASKEILFNRISEQKNFSPQMAPEGKTILCADISCDAAGKLFSASDEEVFQMAKQSLKRSGVVPLSDVDYWFTRRVKHAYPVYSLGYEGLMQTVLDWVDSVENLITLGRQGLFAHNNFHHSVMMGRAAAEHLLSGKPKAEGWNQARKAFDDFKVSD